MELKTLNEIHEEVSLGRVPKSLLHQCITYVSSKFTNTRTSLDSLPSELREVVQLAIESNSEEFTCC